MCGIIGYIGFKQSLPILMEGLRRLEYRGYDSTGVALIENGKIIVSKKAGKVSELQSELKNYSSPSTIGIGHTRWATHGAPTDVNAHPHKDQNGTIALIHNGIIENYQTIKKKLLAEGHTFQSETDTEILSHFIGSLYEKTNDLFTATRLALTEVEGAYAILIISSKEKDKIIAARKGSPLVIGVGENEMFIASDATALISHTKKVVYLEDGEIVQISNNSFITKTITDEEIEKQVHELDLSFEQIEKSGYDHFMLKEIYEQPDSLTNSLRGRVLLEEGDAKLGGLEQVSDLLKNTKRIIITSCGTSWHSSLVGEYIIEQLAGIPVEVEYASEFRYRDPVINKNDVILAVSQSGETADTIAAIREAKRRGATALGVVNAVGSSIARETAAGVYIHAGPEIGVASTKAFTSQVAVFGLIGLLLGRQRGLQIDKGRIIASELLSLPDKIKKALQCVDEVKQIVNEFKDSSHFLFLGRGTNFPTALEGALKLKEISYIHAEGYPAAEMKHGPIALIDNKMPVVFIAPKDMLYEKVMSNIQEVRARGGRIIAIANEDDHEIDEFAEFVIRVPRTLSYFGPIINVIPLQLLAYYMALARNCNVDQPRNLAKSVTVE
ncbi:MAG: glutamine--fructose-6-phosphate transaminase (isomerizing) [Ignavibacteria bacterium]|nr:glutamine--fructose-6-phosphate transaminase (isomerizing) [Ignavibacteria bacterium]